jgi:hypothetical protein
MPAKIGVCEDEAEVATFNGIAIANLTVDADTFSNALFRDVSTDTRCGTQLPYRRVCSVQHGAKRTLRRSPKNTNKCPKWWLMMGSLHSDPIQSIAWVCMKRILPCISPISSEAIHPMVQCYTFWIGMHSSTRECLRTIGLPSTNVGHT